MFELIPVHLPGVFLLKPRVIEDLRGRFVKTLHEGFFTDNALESHFVEEYYSVSRPGVLRGLHFQLPPMDHVKMVYAVAGSVLDAVVDLRKGSPSYGQHALIELSAERGEILYIPKGLAHGFYVHGAEEATLIYKVSTVYSPEHDAGILWNSADIPWPNASPVLSPRDGAFPMLQDFSSPFNFD